MESADFCLKNQASKPNVADSVAEGIVVECEAGCVSASELEVILSIAHASDLKSLQISNRRCFSAPMNAQCPRDFLGRSCLLLSVSLPNDPFAFTK